MKIKYLILGLLACSAMNSAYAIDAKYRELLIQSGCTQVSEMQGCDIYKSKEQNAKAGFVTQQPQQTISNQSTHQTDWVAQKADGSKLATIKTDDAKRVWVNSKRVFFVKKGKDQLQFKKDKITYVIFTEQNRYSQSYWHNQKANMHGKIIVK
ncbi:hypothetical protein [Acinetobacter venetianus]|uniref:hypothetical protein n=1 Tax=Acinetobacter venetianus TaxID=52133 RepID=UPI0007788501|nr:hypothetical protein [Acinetobacter venetianus]KXZ67260.1 hypothetical protein AVENLUH7437_00379 [Acinetobacter venetianus]